MEKTYTSSELAEKAGVQARTIRHYSFMGVLTKPEFRGKLTAYTEQNLAEVLAVRALLQEMRFDHAKAALRKMTPEQIRATAGLVAPPPVPAAPPAPATAKPASPDLPVAPTATATPGEAWSRVTLLPGLELHVRGDAKDFVRRVASEIREKYTSA
jgi:DNA-binding transcriptional MerR regulator